MKKNIKVLYIEDDPETRSLMADIMTYRGFSFHEADRGITGIRLAQKIIPDLIIIDLLLPDMDGYEVTTLLKSLDDLKDKPIIALTAESKPNVKEMTLAAGCDGFISKPINVNEFIFTIEEYLSGRRDRLDDTQQHEFLHKYNVQLVQKLSHKIIELESVNHDLSKVNSELLFSREELARYNDRLFYLNNLANKLRQMQDPDQVLEILPKKTVEGFKIERCIVFRVEQSTSNLIPLSYAGIDQKKIEKQKLPVRPILLEQIKNEGGLIWVRNMHEIIDSGLEKFAKKLQTTNFILSKLNDMASRTDSTQIIKAITEPDQQSDLPERYIIFVDKGMSSHKMATYEVRILKSFIQTVGTIFENMMLYHRLLETYKIRERQAVTDELTGVYNYRYLMRELEREINRTNRFGMPFSVIMFDIDFFKNYNDKHGHPAGDKLLTELATLMTENTRKTDTVARYGGEEFLILLPGLDKSHACEIAKKLHESVRKYKFYKQKEQPNGNLTVSMGLASFPEDGKDRKSIIANVDTALYKAKRNGRDRIEISGD